MQRQLIWTTKFSKDLKLAKKRDFNLNKLKVLLEILQRGENLPVNYKSHQLKGKYSGYMECHIEPDWLLVWKEEQNNIYLARTGTHSDLFR
jgi:mRNA interferase YafQ